MIGGPLAVNEQAGNANSQLSIYGQNFQFASQNDNNFDINAIEQQYRKEAAAKGMNLNEYLNYKQRDMAADKQFLTMMQNISTENHVLMMSTINNIGSCDHYYVYYGDGYGY